MSFFVMPLYILDICLENRDESNGNNILRLWLPFGLEPLGFELRAERQFIPIFEALHSQLRKEPTTKKDISTFSCIEFLRMISGKHLKNNRRVTFSSYFFIRREIIYGGTRFAY